MTNKEMYEYRKGICNACPFFIPLTRSCGKPLSILNPRNPFEEMNGVRFRPCGCDMEIKWRMSLQECPAKVWTAMAEGNIIDQARELITAIKQSGVVTGEQRKFLGYLKGIINGDRKPVSLRHCVGCVNKLVDELGHQLKREESELITEPITESITEPQPKKRGRKPRNK